MAVLEFFEIYILLCWPEVPFDPMCMVDEIKYMPADGTVKTPAEYVIVAAPVGCSATAVSNNAAVAVVVILPCVVE